MFGIFKYLLLISSALKSCKSINVTTPEKDTMIVSGRTFTVEWENSGVNSRFEIDLYHCGSMCMENSCGEWVTALCPYASRGCPDSQGDYDIVMPMPLRGEPGYGYKIGVKGTSDSSFDCSDEFTLLSPDEVSETNEYYLEVFSPTYHDIALIGEEYTVQFDYNNGVGSSTDRFSVDLYKAIGPGDCGEYSAPLCHDLLNGCKDSTGDIDIYIPINTTPGEYKIRVGRFEDRDMFDCSDIFYVMNMDDYSFSYDLNDYSFSY
ncbi:unnamed protein product, partial [Pylaiella littoralis]